MANLLQRLGAFRNKAISHPVDLGDGPQDYDFYPPRMRMLISGQMAAIMKPLSAAFSTLFSSTKEDASRQQEVEENGKVTTYIAGLNPEVIQLRAEKRAAAIQQAVGVLLNDDTRYHLGLLIADSLRDEFSENESERAKQARKFMDDIDLPTMVEILKGYFKALAPVLDKSGNSIFSGLPEMVKREVENVLGKTQVGDESDAEISSDILQMPTTETPTSDEPT